MKEMDRVGALGNDELLRALSSIVKRDNALTAELLAHLAECDERRLHLELGFPSMFAYVTEALGFCEATAWRRVAAARVCRRFPEALSLVETGELHLSAVCALGPHLTQENAQELLDSCRRKSARRIEELLAARFPKPDLRDSIRRLPAHRATPWTEPGTTPQLAHPSTPQIEPAITPLRTHPFTPQPGPVTTPLAHSSSPQTQQMPTSQLPRASAPSRLEPLSANRYGVRFTADGEFRELLERVRGLAGHRLPGGDLATLMKRGLEAYERELLKERFSVGRKSRTKRCAESERKRASNVDAETADVEISNVGSSDTRASNDESSDTRASNDESPESLVSNIEGPTVAAKAPKSQSIQCAKRSRHVAAAIARDVYVRDEGRCTFVSSDGRRCGERRFLEVDHVVPWATGGEQTAANLRLRCAAHNQLHAEQCFGRIHVRNAVARARTALHVEATVHASLPFTRVY
jgi:5-methylcytosine-specific restriction endonuclease McrA